MTAEQARPSESQEEQSSELNGTAPTLHSNPVPISKLTPDQRARLKELRNFEGSLSPGEQNTLAWYEALERGTL